MSGRKFPPFFMQPSPWHGGLIRYHYVKGREECKGKNSVCFYKYEEFTHISWRQKPLHFPAQFGEVHGKAASRQAAGIPVQVSEEREQWGSSPFLSPHVLCSGILPVVFICLFIYSLTYADNNP